MTCNFLGNGLVVCYSPPGIYRRVIHWCPTCEMSTVMVERFAGVWYGYDETCSLCGDEWYDGERGHRPFKRGWREARTARVRTMLDNCLSTEAFDRRVQALFTEAVA